MDEVDISLPSAQGISEIMNENMSYGVCYAAQLSCYRFHLLSALLADNCCMRATFRATSASESETKT